MSSLNQYQDRQCTCDNIEARSCNPCSSGKTTITYSVCVCSLRYPAYNTHAPYCYLWLVRLCLIFPHYLINGTIFGKKSLNVVCVFWFSLLRSYETFLILRRIDEIWSEIFICMWSARYSLHVLLKIWIFSTDFRKVFGYRILWKFVRWEPWCSMLTHGQTDRQTGMTKVIVAFRNLRTHLKK